MRRAAWSQEKGPAAASRAAAASSARADSLPTSSLSAAASAAVSPAATRRAAPVVGDLGEAADVAEHQRLAEGEAGVEDARVLGVAVGEGEDVGGAEDRRDLGVLDEAGEEADAGAGAAAASSCSGSTDIRGLPTIHSSAPSTRPNASSRVSMPL